MNAENIPAKTLYIMCGLPGSGKSTYAKNHCPQDGAIVSRDAIRWKYIDKMKYLRKEGNERQEYYMSKECRVHTEFVSTVVTKLQKHNTVFADATHLNFTSRERFMYEFSQFAWHLDAETFDIVFVFMDTNLETCISRNDKRKTEEHCPNHILSQMADRKHFLAKEELAWYNNLIKKGKIESVIVREGCQV